MKHRERVCVALSGGVDSGASAYLLKQAGYDVFGAFIKVWQPDFLDCSQEDDRQSAKRVAAALGIPFNVVDLTELYKREVVDSFLYSYTHGETPNPDVLCNRVIKFGGLWKWAQEHGATYIATGHYAQIGKDGERVTLLKSADTKKDQSYFLWELPSEALAHTLFPIGHLHKNSVRDIAEDAGLHVATKKDSQGLCFMGALDMQEFLFRMTPQGREPGVVLDEHGVVIGHHYGAYTYTIGQRHNFVLEKPTTSPHYVTNIDVEKNTITVSAKNASAITSFRLRDCVFREQIRKNGSYTVQLRYHGPYVRATIEANGTHATISIDEPQTVSAGQSCVIYNNNVCAGGGIVVVR